MFGKEINMNKSIIGAVFAVIAGTVMTSTAFALPALQLGPGSGTDWTYDTVTDTWVHSGAQPVTLGAYANADPSVTTGVSGSYAWAAGDITRYAYLVVAAMPDLGDIGDILDVSVSGATQVASGYGTPPVEDPNSIAPHSIFDTYFEVYEFQFDGPVITIENTQPPGGDPGKGYREAFSITWSDLTTNEDVDGIHFDLFTVAGDGRYIPGGSDDRQLVNAVAPFSHDAETGSSGTPGEGTPGEGTGVPEPSTLALLGLGMIGGLFVRRQRAKQA